MGGEGGKVVAHVNIVKNLFCPRAQGECTGASGFARHG